MLNALPQPVLKLASEALHLACSDDASPSLWSVFTKCKNYIEDGDRLENISWRIWNRDFQLRSRLLQRRTSIPSVNGALASLSDSDSDIILPVLIHPKDPESLIDSSACPTPVESFGAALPTSIRTGTIRGVPKDLKRPSDSLHVTNSLSNPSKRQRRRLRQENTPPHIGQLICQILPEKLSLIPRRRHIVSVNLPYHHPGMPPSLARQDTDSGIAESVHENEDAEPDKVPQTPLLVIPQYYSPQISPKELSGPRVVIVNATPRPTPPATPDVSQAPSNNFITRPMGNSLAPPSVVPAMFLPEPMSTTSHTAHPTRLAPALVPASYTESTSTQSSDELPQDRARTGKLFYMPKSSPSSDKSGSMVSPPLPTPSSSKLSRAGVAHHSPGSNVLSSVASSNMKGHSLTRKGKMADRRTRSAAARGSLAHKAGKTAAATTKAKKATAATKFEDSSSVGSRSRGHGPKGSSIAKRSSSQARGASHPATSNPHRRNASIQFVTEPTNNAHATRPATLTRVATQPLPHPHNRPTALLEQPGLGPLLRDLHLDKPLVPPPNGNRRKIEIHSTSEDFDSEEDSEEWTSENEGGEGKNDDDDGDEEDQKESDEGEDDGGQLSQAAREAQRQREFFTKLPPRSYSTLGERTPSGLLTSLFKPDPTLFPEGHPYRTSKSHHDLVSKVLAPAQGAMLYGMTPSARRRGPTSPPPPPVRLATSKSAAALPEMVSINALSGSLPRYRPRGAPTNVEVSDSGEEEEGDPEHGLQISKSVVQKRLEALAGQRTSPLAKVEDTAAPSSGSTQSNNDAPITFKPRARPGVRAMHPMALGYPYNLPAPDAPSSPSTTRQRLMNDLSQSTRQSILRDRMTHEPEGFILRRKKEKVSPEVNEAEQRRMKLARNKSWAADDFHTSGW